MGTILENLKEELTAQLKFEMCRFQDQRDPRVGDRISFEVWAINKSDMELRDLKGSITHGKATNFSPKNFKIPFFPANGKLLVKKFKNIEITDNPDDILLGDLIMDSIANIYVQWRPVLTTLKLNHSKKILFKKVVPA
ncbi:MAG: hypothetical protein HKO75_03555 [Flavobacteriaceae bacterium]|nr:hypothetical protein [Muriicola sp.]NNL38916.1 hypothetical protein [Flavobacteriaceae bacterium]